MRLLALFIVVIACGCGASPKPALSLDEQWARLSTAEKKAKTDALIAKYKGSKWVLIGGTGHRKDLDDYMIPRGLLMEAGNGSVVHEVLAPEQLQAECKEALEDFNEMKTGSRFR